MAYFSKDDYKEVRWIFYNVVQGLFLCFVMWRIQVSIKEIEIHTQLSKCLISILVSTLSIQPFSKICIELNILHVESNAKILKFKLILIVTGHVKFTVRLFVKACTLLNPTAWIFLIFFCKKIYAFLYALEPRV